MIVRMSCVIVLLFLVSGCDYSATSDRQPATWNLQANFPLAGEEMSSESLVFCVIHPTWWSSAHITIEFELGNAAGEATEVKSLLSVRLPAGYSGFRQRPDLPADVFIEVNAGTTTWVISDELPRGQYWWRARAIEDGTAHGWMATIPVTVVDSDTPIVVSPKREVMTCSLAGPLIVELPTDMAETVTCDYEIATDPGFLDVLVSSEDVALTGDRTLSIELEQGLPDRFSIWWRSRIRGDGGPRPWGLPSRFYTERLTPPATVIPASGGTIRSVQPELVVINSSLECPSQPQYEFHVSNDPYFDELLFSEVVGQGMFELTSCRLTSSAAEGDTLYWRCRAISRELIGRWSDTAHFTVSSLAPQPSAYADAVAYCGVSCLNAVLYPDCNEALGPPNFTSTANPENPDGYDYDGFVSLGIRGSIILDMGEGMEILNGSGADFIIWQAVSVEQFQVFIAENASGPFIDLGLAGSGWFQEDDPFLSWFMPAGPLYRSDSACYTTSGDGGYSGQLGWCDIQGTGLTTVRYVRIVDMQPWGDLRKDCTWFDYWHTGEWVPDQTAGADIDAVMARYTSS